MRRQKKLGLYWGQKGLSLVEVNKDELSMFSVIPFDSLEHNPIVGIKSLVDDVRLLDLIQTAYRAAQFSTIDTYLSLPSKDTIIRWFVIPWMKPSEIQGVVAFEARKYIPFPLEELFFTYYPSVFLRDGIRQVGISFVAIRKTTLSSYLNVLRQSGLNVVYSEPSSLSLVRSLASKKMIDTKAVTAILNFNEDFAEIIITSQGYVRFIRDFKLAIPEEGLSEEQQNVIRAKMFNEVKMSLDFFTRQQADADVSGIITISSGASRDILKGLSEDLGIPVRYVDPLTVFDKNFSPNTGHVYAFGVALSGDVPSVIDLDLSEERDGASSVKEIRSGSGPVKTKVLMLVLGVCTTLVVISSAFFFWSGGLVAEREREKAALVKGLGTYAEKSVEDIQAKNTSEGGTLKAIKSLRFRSVVAPFFVSLIKVIPEGIWFQSLKFVLEPGLKSSVSGGNHYQANQGMKLDIEGYVYLDSANAEFQTINYFVGLLRDNKAFSSSFTSVKLGTSRRTTLGKFQVTFFVINCE